MKKVVNMLLIVTCFIVLLTTTVIVKAEQNKEIAMEQEQDVSYVLPYPGMLPDNPLYFLKEIRDKVVGWLITDPVRKVEYLLLMSDKRVNSAVMLINKGEEEVGAETLNGAMSYLEETKGGVERLKNDSLDYKTVGNKVVLATKKYGQELMKVEKNTKRVNEEVEKTIEESKRIGEEIEGMIKE